MLGDDPAPTGVAGRVITVAGAPVAGAVIVHRTSEGEPCSPHDVANLTGPQGFFQAPLSPGLCLVSAKLHGRATPKVAVEIEQGRLTIVTLVMP